MINYQKSLKCFLFAKNTGCKNNIKLQEAWTKNFAIARQLSIAPCPLYFTSDLFFMSTKQSSQLPYETDHKTSIIF